MTDYFRELAQHLTEIFPPGWGFLSYRFCFNLSKNDSELTMKNPHSFTRPQEMPLSINEKEPATRDTI